MSRRRARPAPPEPGPVAPARKPSSGEALGPCGLCGRPMVAGPSVDRHHLVPKSRGGTEVVWMHTICHGKIHSLLSEKALAREYSSFEALREHPDLDPFIAWVRKKPPEFVSRNRRARR